MSTVSKAQLLPVFNSLDKVKFNPRGTTASQYLS